MDTALAIWLLGIVFTLLFSIIGFFMKSLYTRLERVEDDTKDFKFNYLDRFAKVMEVLSSIKEDIATITATIKKD